MQTSNVQRINGCAFCRASHKDWTTHTVETCVELANCVCGYCKEKGHTPKKCPKLALKKQRETLKQDKLEENFPTLTPVAKEATPKKATWASLVVNTLSTEERDKIEQRHQTHKLQEADEKRRAFEERRKRREELNQRRIERTYGLPKNNGFCPEGSFWYFYVDGHSDDSKAAQLLRDDKKNQMNFRSYLNEKYGSKWLYDSEDTKDDCCILDHWRYIEDELNYLIVMNYAEQYVEQQNILDDYTMAKLESGELSSF